MKTTLAPLKTVVTARKQNAEKLWSLVVGAFWTVKKLPNRQSPSCEPSHGVKLADRLHGQSIADELVNL
jgi:hypothetical protein